VLESNTRGYVSFATSGPNSRTTQMFINFNNNARLDGMGFAPFAQVSLEDMAVVDRIYSGYIEYSSYYYHINENFSSFSFSLFLSHNKIFLRILSI